MTLSFAGLVPLALGGERRGGAGTMGAAGALLGLSVWLRPECVFLAAGALLVTVTLDSPLRSRFIYSASVAFALAGFLLVNIWFYGRPLGMHAIQALEPGQLVAPQPPPLVIAYDLGRYFILFSPVIAAVAAVALAGWRLGGPLRPDRREGRIWIVLALFLAGTPFLLPTTGGKQFGPRFWLPAVPLLWVIVSFQLQRLAASPRRSWSRALVGIIILATIAGGIFNTSLGVSYLRRDYRERVLPALDFLRTREESSVAVDHQYIAQELEALFGQKNFFRVLDGERFKDLAVRLHAMGQGSFLWLRYDSSGAGTLRLPGLTVRRDLIGRYREYYVFRCLVGESAP